ncbi:MAG: LysR family transcriptional regulator [Clostridiales bacterium]|nr:LysR family transcriptional regulator [Clostridiales bacterium]
MQLEHLALFMKIAQEKSISKVANASHISQPALSLQMQKLEDALGCRLFERSNRGIQLTDAGMITKRYAAQLMFTYEQFVEELHNLRNHNDTCRVAATQVAANYAIPCTLVKAKEKFPDFTFTLASMPSREVLRQVLGSQADIGFIVGETQESELFCKNVFSDQVVLVAAKDYTVRQSLSVEGLKHHPLVLLDESFSSYRMMADQLKSMGYDLDQFKVSYHLDSTESVKSMVMSGNGLTFLPYMAVKKEIYLQQLKIVDTENFCLRYDVSIVYKQKTENGNFQMAMVKKYFENMVPTTIC